nr:putative F-box protein At1g19160 [Ipomoea batatas]
MTFDVFALNPSTREVKALPSIKLPRKPSNKPPIKNFLHVMFGFGLSKNMVWKIVMLLRFEDIDLREDGYEIVMVCSQVGDSWNWRQIDAVPEGPRQYLLLSNTRDFYLKGRYYWLCCESGLLIWFDLDDENFGKIKIPLECRTEIITIMNDTIALIDFAKLVGDERFINIWLMDENDNCITWRKHSTIHFGRMSDHYWTPVGIWNLGGQLLVFSSDIEIRYNEIDGEDDVIFKDGSGPNLISIDLVTREKKIICTCEVKKSAIKIGLNLAGNAQIVRERNINKDEEWNDSNIAWFCYVQRPYARDFHESLKFI